MDNGSADYTAMSPHAGYDSKRNERAINHQMTNVLNKTYDDNSVSHISIDAVPEDSNNAFKNKTREE